MKWEHARERRGDKRLSFFDPRVTRLEVAAFLISVVIFIAATEWAYPGVAPLLGFAAAAVVRLIGVGVLHVTRSKRDT